MEFNNTVLSTINHHLRDDNIRFYETGHKYEILTDPDSKYTSVTTWNHHHFPKFDADAVIKNMMKGKNWNPTNKYWGMTPTEIKNMWSKNGESVSSAGTNMHAYIEGFMNNPNIAAGYTHADLFFEYNSKTSSTETAVSDPIETTLEWQYFLRFIGDHLHLKPYRTEWMIFHEDIKIAGSVDMIYENEDGSLSIYDWKRSKDIVKDPSFKKYATNPLISHILDSNYWHYALQLNTYKKILEDKYGKTVRELVLVRLHPDAVEKSYELIPLPILTTEMDALFNERKQMFI